MEWKFPKLGMSILEAPVRFCLHFASRFSFPETQHLCTFLTQKLPTFNKESLNNNKF